MIGTELLDLHLASDAVSESEEDAALAAGDAGEQQASRSFTGPAGLRLAKVHFHLRRVLALPLRQYGRAAGRALLYWALYETCQNPVGKLSNPFRTYKHCRAAGCVLLHGPRWPATRQLWCLLP